MASSSMPICSMSSAVRWAIGFAVLFCTVVMGTPGGCVDSVVEVAVAGGGADAGLDHHRVAGGGGDFAVAQVADRAFAHRQDAAVTDAHAAAGRHEDAGGFGGIEDRGGAVGGD